MKAYALKESTGRYRCRNVMVSEEEYHRNIVNACLYDDKKVAEAIAERTNRLYREEFLTVVTVHMKVEEDDMDRGTYGGRTTLMKTLSVGTKFFVHNGHWEGEIVMKDGLKCVMFKGDVLDNAMPIEDDKTLEISIRQ